MIPLKCFVDGKAQSSINQLTLRSIYFTFAFSNTNLMFPSLKHKYLSISKFLFVIIVEVNISWVSAWKFVLQIGRALRKVWNIQFTRMKNYMKNLFKTNAWNAKIRTQFCKYNLWPICTSLFIYHFTTSFPIVFSMNNYAFIIPCDL